eukprot:g4600.t1
MFELDATRLGLNDPQGVNADRILLRSLRAQDDHVPALQKGQRLALPRRLWETEEELREAFSEGDRRRRRRWQTHWSGSVLDERKQPHARRVDPERRNRRTPRRSGNVWQKLSSREHFSGTALRKHGLVTTQQQLDEFFAHRGAGLDHAINRIDRPLEGTFYSQRRSHEQSIARRGGYTALDVGPPPPMLTDEQIRALELDMVDLEAELEM